MNFLYYDQLHDLMMQSGRLIMNAFCGDFEIIQKKDQSFCTSVDVSVELLLRQGLQVIFPDASCIGEELGILQVESLEENDWRWVIDPLDGTKNFIHGIPHFCVMVALTYKNSPVIAGIYLPVTGDFYYAEQGKGLWLNKIHKIVYADNQILTKKSALVACSNRTFQSMRVVGDDKNIVISRRYFGSAGIDAIYLATGSFDFIMFENIAWWDIAAGMLCIAEAQGLRYAYKQQDEKTLSGNFAAGNEFLFSIFHDNNQQNL